VFWAVCLLWMVQTAAVQSSALDPSSLHIIHLPSFLSYQLTPLWSPVLLLSCRSGRTGRAAAAGVSGSAAHPAAATVTVRGVTTVTGIVNGTGSAATGTVVGVTTVAAGGGGITGMVAGVGATRRC
jgi:hypothetical protein